MNKLLSILKNKKLRMMAIDLFVLCLSGAVAYFMANSFEFVSFKVNRIMPGLGIFILVNIISMYAFGVYKNLWKYSKVSEFVDCVGAMTTGSVISAFLIHILGINVSNIYSLLLYLVSMVSIIISRSMYSYIYDIIRRNSAKARDKENTLIIGAGYTCRKIIDEMNSMDMCSYEPVVIVDDDETKLNMSINAIPIVGNTEDIPSIVKEYEIRTIIFAIPSCNPKDRNRIMKICSETDCSINVMPSLNDLLKAKSFLSQVQPVDIDDLLGRDVVIIDDERVEKTISGKVCLVTGGGGSIGSELARQIMDNGPKKLVIVDIYENNAYDIQQELIARYGKTKAPEVQIASVRDYEKMENIFIKFKPSIVFHAAAHKHVPLMENNPEEAIKNNIFGTLNVAKLSEKYEAEKMVLISTDKAVNPTNVMGATKRCCEMVMQYMAQRNSNTKYIAVRFGNVLGSNGSVIPLFEKQIKANKPITVTHPDIIRYFMTIPEAVSLILEAATIAEDSDIFVLNMGEPVKILTLAENLIRLHGKEPYKDVDIIFTGLRPGEKLFEELLIDEEGIRTTANDRIFIGKQLVVNSKEFEGQLDDLKRCADENDSEKCVKELLKIVPTFRRESKKAMIKDMA